MIFVDRNVQRNFFYHVYQGLEIVVINGLLNNSEHIENENTSQCLVTITTDNSKL